MWVDGMRRSIYLRRTTDYYSLVLLVASCAEREVIGASEVSCCGWPMVVTEDGGSLGLSIGMSRDRPKFERVCPFYGQLFS